ncbi:MAG: hypothetical protein ORN53_08915 [Crocinitomicaceae bacterium]|nr:hypothetical protein [Crocinitomicaceae bacterium]
MLTLENGDQLEASYSEFIRNNISNYELIWSDFIGNDGNGHIPTCGLEPEINRLRADVGQQLYTVIESIICMELIKSKQLEEIENFQDYLEIINSLMSFHSHMVRVHDNLQKIAMILFNISKGETKEILKPVEDFYQKRNNILHSRKLPIRFYDTALLIPGIGGANPKPGEWHDKLTWDSTDGEDYAFLESYFEESVIKLCKSVNEVLCKLIKPVKELIKNYNIVIPDINKKEKATADTVNFYNMPLSGSQYTFINELYK